MVSQASPCLLLTQPAQSDYSAGDVDVLISEQGSPTPFVRNYVRGQYSEETSGWLLALWGD